MYDRCCLAVSESDARHPAPPVRNRQREIAKHISVHFGIEWSNTTPKETSTMDLELSRKQFDCYRAEVPLVLTIEEAAE